MMATEYLSIPGYLPAKQAAHYLGCSTERVLQFARAGRLPSRVVDGRYLIPESALTAFHPKPHGRIRTKPVPWRRYRTTTVYMRQIDVPIVPDCAKDVALVVEAITESQEHLFPGAMTRFISIEDGTLALLLIWKSTEMDVKQLEHAVEAFLADFVGLLDWERMRDVTREAVAYT